MRTSDFDYFLPEELIAQHPPEKRGDSRMLVLDPAKGTREILPFAAFPDFFNKGDTLVLNNTKVIKARLFAMKEARRRSATPSGGRRLPSERIRSSAWA